ncbi:hypothetical protein HGO97_022635 [Faecalicatena sp. AGMB00832]|uniref:Uncharacterized protein n=1 Tax=Faecalicatena faecalis TaxID=2726362 RepID=A0ABS6DAE0_9FIRM|nr:MULTISPECIES: DUF6179 domain-containing protein [Faecalicatena]MBU3878598.1 hypothetical protein [Faecalicatena faecalis]MCI6468187.1 DUF6179 domain-containing protein [Faecalicatena sp.]MDY5620442.1 DUF6179 domain-containing protein [Lachnospiraceae bacterium]
MNYKVEELMPVVARLADKYTSKESTSISYDTAQQLMEAVWYCIRECEGEKRDSLLEGAQIGCMTAYEEGYRIALNKVLTAKELYHQIAVGFDDFGCRNYRETIIKGMPVFFTKYDVRFEPQNQILTLDYPVLNLNLEKKGIDLILEYLEKTAYEQKFLKYFSRRGVMRLLEQRCMDYRELYLDNICEPVLLRGAACLAAETVVYKLKLEEEDVVAAKEYFMTEPTVRQMSNSKENSMKQLERKLEVLYDVLERNIMKEDYKGIFRSCAHEAAVRLNSNVQLL